jgi:hypothetical protein
MIGPYWSYHFIQPVPTVCHEFVGVRSYERNRNKTRRDLNMLVDFRVVEKDGKISANFFEWLMTRM